VSQQLGNLHGWGSLTNNLDLRFSYVTPSLKITSLLLA